MPESSYPSPNTHPVLILTQLISSELNMIIIITSHHPPSILQASSQHPSIILPASSQCPPSILPSSSQHPPIILPASSQHPPIIFPSSSQHPPSILPSSPQHPPSIVPSFSQYPPISDTTSQAPHLRLHISASTSQTSHLRIHIIVTIKCPMRTIQRRLVDPSATIHDWWWWMMKKYFYEQFLFWDGFCWGFPRIHRKVVVTHSGSRNVPKMDTKMEQSGPKIDPLPHLGVTHSGSKIHGNPRAKMGDRRFC